MSTVTWRFVPPAGLLCRWQMCHTVREYWLSHRSRFVEGSIGGDLAESVP